MIEDDFGSGLFRAQKPLLGALFHGPARLRGQIYVNTFSHFGSAVQQRMGHMVLPEAQVALPRGSGSFLYSCSVPLFDR
ncbi:MAG: hypothetical protein ACLU3F_15180 [Blautia wexlerae]